MTKIKFLSCSNSDCRLVEVDGKVGYLIRLVDEKMASTLCFCFAEAERIDAAAQIWAASKKIIHGFEIQCESQTHYCPSWADLGDNPRVVEETPAYLFEGGHDDRCPNPQVGVYTKEIPTGDCWAIRKGTEFKPLFGKEIPKRGRIGGVHCMGGCRDNPTSPCII